MRAWTRKEEQKLKRLHQRFTLENLAIVMDRSVHSVRKKATQLGLESPFVSLGTEPEFYAEDIAVMFELKEQGFTVSHLAKFFRTTTARIRLHLDRAELKGMQAYKRRPQ